MTRTRTVRRSLAVTGLGLLLTGTCGVSAATADPWLSWTVVRGADPGGVLDARVFAADATGGTRSPLARWGGAVAVDASDDGRVAAYTVQRRRAGHAAPRTRLLVVVDGRRTTYGSGYHGQPDVSPDGTSVTVGRRARVVRYDVALGTATVLCRDCTSFPGSRGMRPRAANVALSPDGAYVAIRIWTEGDAEALAIHRTSDGVRVALKTMGEGEPDIAMAWTADSRQLGYVALASLGAPDYRAVWRIDLLGVDGATTPTSVSAPTRQRLSGPMRVGATWYVVRTPGSAPSGRRATVLATPSLSTAPEPVGTVTTRGRSRDLPYVGTWSIIGAPPAPLG